MSSPARLFSQLSKDYKIALTVLKGLMEEDKTGNIHSVGWGLIQKGGEDTGEEGVVVTVKQKGIPAVRDGSPYVPEVCAGVFTDVQEQPEQEIRILRGDKSTFEFNPRSVHQQCYNTPIPGGVECFPIGKAWLGTLGCKVVYMGSNGSLHHGAITNWHVATGVVGTKMGQPGGNNEYFGIVNSSPGVSFNGVNYVDLSVLSIKRIDGKYAPVTHTVKPEQVTLGEYASEISFGGLGTIVARDGRTLGRVTGGRVVQIGVTVRVGYGNGTATFQDQFVVTKDGGEFSLPGDSGSMVFEWPVMRPFGLLFAGGGGTTIVSPAEYIVSLGNVVSFS